MPDPITVAQAAERLGVSPRQVLHLIKAGRLYAYRVGASLTWLIPPEAVETYQRRPTGRPPRTEPNPDSPRPTVAERR